MEQKLGLLIRQLRTAKGLSQAELARAVHVNGSYIGLLENGVRRPSDGIIVRLADALDVNKATIYEAAGIIQLNQIDEERLRRAIIEEPISNILKIKYNLNNVDYVAQVLEMAVERERALEEKQEDSVQHRQNRRSNADSSEDPDNGEEQQTEGLEGSLLHTPL